MTGTSSRSASASDPNRAPRRRLPLFLLVAVVLLAALFWLVFWQQSAASALTRVPVLDEAWYLQEASRLRAEGLPGRRPFVMSPGYSLLVAASGARAPDEQGVLRRQPHALLAWQALAWLGCGLLGGWFVRRIGKQAGCGDGASLTAAALTALLWLLYQPAAIHARMILLEVLLVLGVTIALVAATGGRRNSWRSLVVAGLGLGLAAALRAQVLVVALPVLVAFWRRGGRRSQRLPMSAVLIALVLLPCGLAVWHNSRLSGELVGPSLNAGLNLYLGQVASEQGLFTSLDGFDQERQPSGEGHLANQLGRPVSGPAEADRLWRQEAWRLAASDPGRAVRGWWRKVWLHVQAWEIAQVTPLSAWPAEAPVLRVLVVPWGLLALAGLAGAVAVLTLRRRAGDECSTTLPVTTAGWLAAALLLVAVQSLFFVVARYRLPLAMILAVLAGLGLLALVQLWSRHRWRGLAAPLLAVPVLALVIHPWGLATVRAQWSALEAANLARRLAVLAVASPDPADRGRLHERAEALLASASATVPGRQDVARLRAANLVDAGRPEAALAVLEAASARMDDPALLRRQRVGLLLALGRLDEAERTMREHIDRSGDDADMRHDLVVLLGRQGRWSEAATAARALQRSAPTDHRGWLGLGVALAAQGNRDDAVRVLREGLQRFTAEPARSQLAANLERIESSSRDR